MANLRVALLTRLTGWGDPRVFARLCPPVNASTHPLISRERHMGQPKKPIRRRQPAAVLFGDMSLPKRPSVADWVSLTAAYLKTDVRHYEFGATQAHSPYFPLNDTSLISRILSDTMFLEYVFDVD
ncbi:hypothetical protein AVEN_203758-1 [Araneus ventricosus]|uniref:Uncharacterized protein n=1 Tax=Araneus ventricosus TaxID=182803 RepID=A0A4Y2GHB0_ARAVE|nr:hypothetical protein AVEN_203758-1 [Araneus ventricosus]